MSQTSFFSSRAARTLALLFIFGTALTIRLYDLTDLPARSRGASSGRGREFADAGLAHLLLALADFPAVVARRLDAEPGPDSPWHAIGRALLTRGVALGVTVLDDDPRRGALTPFPDQR